MLIDQISLGSLIRIVTASSRVFIPSNTLSSNTVVNSCSIEVSKATIFRESTFISRLRSASKRTFLTSIISRSLMTLNILVSIFVYDYILSFVRELEGREDFFRSWGATCQHDEDWHY